MKVLLFNGSPNANGCTFTALSEVEKDTISLLQSLGVPKAKAEKAVATAIKEASSLEDVARLALKNL